ARRQGQHARSAARAARLVNAFDALGRHGQVGAEWRPFIDRMLEVGLGGEGQARQVGEFQRASNAGLAEAPGVKVRMVEEMPELLLPRRRSARERLLVVLGLDLAIPYGVAVAG